MVRSQSWIIPTVMSPEKGGPVYNQLRANFAYARRMVIRHPFRWLLDNWLRRVSRVISGMFSMMARS